jgi:hypothetical protein
MKALISPNESFTLAWVSSWNGDVPVYSEILDCQRVVEVEPEAFDVAPPLFWVDCPNDCVADDWYFKDGQCLIKPQNAPEPPIVPIEVLP